MKKIKSLVRRNHLRKCFSSLSEKTILSNNCIAYFIYKDLNCKYFSPTIGVQIPILDFVKFINNIDYYAEQQLIEGESKDFEFDFRNVGGGNIDFPCAYLGDIKIMFQHEKHFNEAKEKWMRRMQRTKKDPIVIIWVHSYELSQNVVEKIESVKKQKIVLTDAKIMKKYRDWFYLKMPQGKEWWEQDNIGLRYFEKLRWNKMLKERM